jgi:FkbM family methyltransferase
MVTEKVRQVLRVYWHRIYPWTALNGLDKKLVSHLKMESGFFIEAGANDGVRQSNTYYLEKRLGWTGLLVEPVPRLAERCRKSRKKSIVEQCILVGPEDSGRCFDVMDLDLMTFVVDQEQQGRNTETHIRDAEKIQGIKRTILRAPGHTLSDLLDRHGVTSVDLLSLDVEGTERTVLSGLDLERHSPRFILVETKVPDLIKETLGERYVLVTQLSHHDYLFHLK